MITFGIEIPDEIWLSSNGTQPHWAVEQRAIKALQLLGRNVINMNGSPRLERAHMTAYIQVRGGRFDPPNAWPTIKPIVDGMIQAGLLPDDSDKYLIGPDFRREPGRAPKGIRRIRFEIEELPC